MSLLRRGFSVAVLLLAIIPAAGAQTVDTDALVREVGALVPADLPALEARARRGEGHAQILLGLVHEMGAAGQVASATEALAWFRKAADQQIGWAEMWAGDFYFNGGPGVPRDLYQALMMYTSASEHGELRAAFLVGRMYFFGDGVSVNHQEAARWFAKAAPVDRDSAGRLVALASASCDTTFCVSLRQVMGALMIMADEYVGDWDDTASEWDSTRILSGFGRCGFTSSDRTEQGDVRNFFCDTPTFQNAEAGAASARVIADDVARALPGAWERGSEQGNVNESYLFTQEGYPRVRVTFNRTPGKAPQRVTLLVGF